MSWNNLSLKEKANLMRVYVKNGVTSIDDMISHYDNYNSYEDFRNKVEEPNNSNSFAPYKEREILGSTTTSGDNSFAYGGSLEGVMLEKPFSYAPIPAVRYATGGKTVSQLWTEKTGLSWSEVGKYYDKYDGSAKGNLALREQLLKGQYDNLKQQSAPQKPSANKDLTYQIWEDRTGTKWQDVGKYVNEYDKSYSGNMAIRDKLLKGEYDYIKGDAKKTSGTTSSSTSGTQASATVKKTSNTPQTKPAASVTTQPAGKKTNTTSVNSVSTKPITTTTTTATTSSTNAKDFSTNKAVNQVINNVENLGFTVYSSKDYAFMHNNTTNATINPNAVQSPLQTTNVTSQPQQTSANKQVSTKANPSVTAANNKQVATQTNNASTSYNFPITEGYMWTPTNNPQSEVQASTVATPTTVAAATPTATQVIASPVIATQNNIQTQPSVNNNNLVTGVDGMVEKETYNISLGEGFMFNSQDIQDSLANITHESKPVTTTTNSTASTNQQVEKEVVEQKGNTFLDNIAGFFSRNKRDNEGIPEQNTGEFKSNVIDIDSEYGIVPESFTGDTLKVDSRRYLIPESINVSDYSYGVRNRGDYNEIDSEAATITLSNQFVPYSSNAESGTYIGISKDGSIKAGDISEFGDGDMISKTSATVVYNFDKDDSGNYIWGKDDTNEKGRRDTVRVSSVDDKTGKQTSGYSVNLFSGKKDKSGKTFGDETGGRVLVKVGNEFRLLSGSVSNIEEQFEEMKQRQGVDHGTFYSLDNGSYNTGLRTYDKKFTTEDLKSYDSQNEEGGHFLYIKGPHQKYEERVLDTPNKRTEESDSYKAGHGLINEKQGVVLHHTAFMGEDDGRAVINHFQNPNTEASAHVVIDFNGKRTRFGTDDDVLFHAGESYHNGRASVNDFMLGIEFQGDTNRKALTDAQIESAVEYLAPRIRAYNIKLEDIVTHKQVRDMYNKYCEQFNLGPKATGKPDLSSSEYERVVMKLLETVYYKKQDNLGSSKKEVDSKK